MSFLVVEALNVYGFDKLLLDIRQHTSLVKAVLIPVATWVPSPNIHLQMKTGDEMSWKDKIYLKWLDCGGCGMAGERN